MSLGTRNQGIKIDRILQPLSIHFSLYCQKEIRQIRYFVELHENMYAHTRMVHDSVHPACRGGRALTSHSGTAHMWRAGRLDAREDDAVIAPGLARRRALFRSIPLLSRSDHPLASKSQSQLPHIIFPFLSTLGPHFLLISALPFKTSLDTNQFRLFSTFFTFLVHSNQ